MTCNDCGKEIDDCDRNGCRQGERPMFPARSYFCDESHPNYMARCVQPRGHKGPHSGDGQTWPTAK